MHKLLSALVLSAALSSPALAGEPETHLVVINKAGPAWDQFAEYAAESRRHFDIYKTLADQGLILVGGRLDGATPDDVLGISIFRKDVDRPTIKAKLENDPLFKAGVTALEYREWTVQMGEMRSK
jgi:hypothetical protein